MKQLAVRILLNGPHLLEDEGLIPFRHYKEDTRQLAGEELVLKTSSG